MNLDKLHLYHPWIKSNQMTHTYSTSGKEWVGLEEGTAQIQLG